MSEHGEGDDSGYECDEREITVVQMHVASAAWPAFLLDDLVRAHQQRRQWSVKRLAIFR